MTETERDVVFNAIKERLLILSENDLLWIMRKIGLDLQDSDGSTLLHYSAKSGLDAVCKALIKAGACLTMEDNKGKLPSDVALESGHIDLALTLRPSEQLNTMTSEVMLNTAESFTQHASRGTFNPTILTSLLDDAPNWDLPEDLNDQRNPSLNPPTSDDEGDFSVEIARVSRFLKAEGISPESSIVAMYLRFADIFRILNLANPEDDSFLFESFHEDEGVLNKLINLLVDPSTVADSVISKAYLLEKDFKNLRLDIVKQINIPSEGTLKPEIVLVENIKKDEKSIINQLLMQIEVIIDEIKNFANYLDKNITAYKEVEPNLWIDYFRASIEFNIMVSNLCELAAREAFRELEMSSKEKKDFDWFRPDAVIEVPTDLLESITKALKSKKTCLQEKRLDRLGLDNRLWKFEGH